MVPLMMFFILIFDEENLDLGFTERNIKNFFNSVNKKENLDLRFTWRGRARPNSLFMSIKLPIKLKITI